jgi:HEAT repeat protein
MVNSGNRWLATVFCVFLAGAAGAAGGLESQRLERAKDLIAEEQWLRAISELRAAVADPKEAQKDEALFWLAHSQNQARQFVAALEAIGRLEKAYPASRWLRPAQSLRLEIAQRLGQVDVLWYTARPAPPPPAPPAPGAPPAPPVPGATPPTPVTLPPPRPPAAAPPPPAPRDAPRVISITPGTPEVPTIWIPAPFSADTDLRIQALGSLIRTDAEKVIPILKEIALDGENPGPARRALFVLAQSGRPEARSTVVEVARHGAEPIQIAAVRELGRLEGATVANELLQVYTGANTSVRYQVVNALGERAATAALLRIAQQESNAQLREAAVTTLGTAGGRDQLNVLYARAGAEMKRVVLSGYFNAKADEELIRIARTERDPALRQEALVKLRVLGTPRALAFLETVRDK